VTTRLILLIAACAGGLLSPALQAQDTHQARQLAATCANCHAIAAGPASALKPLAGMPADQIIQAMAQYRSGSQPATIMHQIAKGYTEAQVRLLAAYLAAQPPRP
jgi:sulfide dehydrogenase cytochrome subunit